MGNVRGTQKEKRAVLRETVLSCTRVPVEELTVSAGTVRTRYLAAGSGNPIVMLHGAGPGAAEWFPVINPYPGACT